MTNSTKQRSRGSTWVLGLLPLVVLAAVLVVFVRTNPVSEFRQGVPPVEELSIQRVTLDSNPKELVAYVTNGGPAPVTVAQVRIDDAYWNFEMSPAGPEIQRLGRATIRVPYAWVEGEALHLAIVSSTGVAFTHDVDVTVETPRVTSKTLVTFTLLGIFVGVIPVLIGVGWFPFIRRLRQRWMNFFLALTAGLLVFLAVDALDEALSASANVPGAFQGVGLIVLGVVAALATLYAVDGWMRRRRGELSPLYVASLIAIGIGLHNLGEGLAIGAAFALGEVGLGSFLVLGFMIHNVTEGLGIVSPLARSSPGLKQLVGLGLLAGLPTIAGTWTGGLVYSPILAVLFLAIGAGAILQVVWEIGKLLRTDKAALGAPLTAFGFTAGILVMYGTGLVVAA